METIYYKIALITAGIALAMGLIALFVGLPKNGDKVDLIFGIMCISLFLHFTLPPAGFVALDKAPYPPTIVFKRLFNFLYAILFPWFVMLYTGYKNKLIPIFANILYVFAYLIMAFSNADSNQPLWVTVILLPIGISVVYGFVAINYQIKFGDKNKAYWFFSAMLVFALLYLVTAINQFGNYLFHAKIFYPINLFPLAFMLIMGVRLRANTFQKFILEKLLRLREKRWQVMLENIQLIVLELDLQGKIRFINPYGVKLLGYDSVNDLLDQDWFGNYLPVHEAGIAKSIYLSEIIKGQTVSIYKSEIKTKTNKWRTINWSNILVHDEKGAIIGLQSIGSDITNEENAYREISDLKSELEKENLQLKGEINPDLINGEIIGNSQAIKYAIQKAKQVAGSTATVLLEGETGVGKELFANLIRDIGLRQKGPFIKVNCGALPAELIEDELFGHEKGAFTGALLARKGRFEMADGGTIFLDEIGELPLALQTKLLRVLQNNEFERVGGQQTIKVDVRVISATNRDLSEEVQKGNFREDLYYRLNVFPITIPPLRSRKEDIPLLINYFIEKKSIKHRKKIEHISKADINRLCEYSWPGNIRELKNVIERAVISATSDTLKLDWWSGAHTNSKINQFHTPIALDEVEKVHITNILNECYWKISGSNGAAEKLGMPASTLRSKMKKLNIYRSPDTTKSKIG